ncbi:hypothetical protein Ocin01_17043 [Orchesella cincta]|uniref:Chitin-binding type-4 domain-containing protein n=1 Tax=Orchesella cincta TaxID=48709 RepID=A0A1D2M9M1_ORCCI|nr:hypothetical protein Ocin01_17043 [Orchesella cincta]
MARFTIIALVSALVAIAQVTGHGRMMKPPNRSSIWRVPEFASQNPPPNYSDNELYCGGIHQADDPGTNCGVCGDRKSAAAPRDNEMNGKYYRGIITGRYTAGQVIDVEIDLTTAHKGNMEWRLCTNPSQETQACFNQHVLRLANGSGTKLPAGNSGIHRTQLRLPAGVRCNHCVLQWNYRAGNNWGDCGDGTSASGCGPQETFRGCSDISIS